MLIAGLTQREQPIDDGREFLRRRLAVDLWLYDFDAEWVLPSAESPT